MIHTRAGIRPGDLAVLARLHAIEISDTRWDYEGAARDDWYCTPRSTPDSPNGHAGSAV